MSSPDISVGSTCWTIDEDQALQIVQVQEIDNAAQRATVSSLSHTFTTHVRLLVLKHLWPFINTYSAIFGLKLRL